MTRSERAGGPQSTLVVMSIRRSRQSGIAMMLVLATIVVSSVLGMSYLTVATVKMKGSANVLRASRAKYLSESAVHHALYLLRHDPSALDGTSETSPRGPFYADGSGDGYTFYAVSTAPLEYEVTGKATCLGITRTSRVLVQVYNEYKERLLALGPLHYWRLGEHAGDTAHDLTGGKDGQYKNGVALGQGGAIAGDADLAAGFDGVNDHVEIEEVDVPGTGLTLIAWFKAEDFAVSDGRLISKAFGLTDQEHYWMLSTVRAGGYMRLRFRLKVSGWTAVQVADSGDLEPHAWTMAAGTFDGLRMRLYKDGERMGTMFHFGSISVNDGIKTWIGGNPTVDTSRPFHGVIDDVAIFDKRLDGTILQELYEARIGRIRILSWNP